MYVWCWAQTAWGSSFYLQLPLRVPPVWERFPVKSDLDPQLSHRRWQLTFVAGLDVRADDLNGADAVQQLTWPSWLIQDNALARVLYCVLITRSLYLIQCNTVCLINCHLVFMMRCWPTRNTRNVLCLWCFAMRKDMGPSCPLDWIFVKSLY